MVKVQFIFLIFILVALTLSINAHAIAPPEPEPARIDLGDGLVFYLTPPEFVEQGYPVSGLYRDGELIYTFYDWRLWSFTGAMFFSDDAMSLLVVHPTIIWTDLNFAPVRFYERGVFSHSIEAHDLLRHGVRMLEEPDPFSGLSDWIVRNNRRHDRVNNRLEVLTVEGYRITFDLSTGTVLSQLLSPEHVPPGVQTNRTHIIIVLVVVALVVSGVLIVVIRKIRR